TSLSRMMLLHVSPGAGAFRPETTVRLQRLDREAKQELMMPLGGLGTAQGSLNWDGTLTRHEPDARAKEARPVDCKEAIVARPSLPRACIGRINIACIPTKTLVRWPGSPIRCSSRARRRRTPARPFRRAGPCGVPGRAASRCAVRPPAARPGHLW